MGMLFLASSVISRTWTPIFDFDAAIALVPLAIRGDLAHWVEDNMDALVRAFTADDDGVVVAADESGVVNGPGADDGGVEGEGEASDASGDSGGAPALFLLFTLRRESSGMALRIVRAFWEGEPLI